jgi:chromosomal replication initiation ATPase DnaA
MMEARNANVWELILDSVRQEVPAEDFRRWFGETGYASDSGDQVTVWVTTEAIRRHLENHYHDLLTRILQALGRPNTTIRFAVAGFGDEDEDGGNEER